MSNVEENHRWNELQECKYEFQKIVNLLVEFDEKTGRYRRYPDRETHFMRKAISVGDTDCMRIFLQHLGGFVYHVVVELSIKGGQVCTGWVHEDGIRVERDEFQESKTHPVHSILCMTDLYEKNSMPLSDDPVEMCVAESTLTLLFESKLELK